MLKLSTKHQTLIFRLDNQAESLRQRSFNMEQATMSLRTAQDSNVIYKAMATGTKQMKKEFKKTNIDDIEVSLPKIHLGGSM